MGHQNARPHDDDKRSNSRPAHARAVLVLGDEVQSANERARVHSWPSIKLPRRQRPRDRRRPAPCNNWASRSGEDGQGRGRGEGRRQVVDLSTKLTGSPSVSDPDDRDPEALQVPVTGTAHVMAEAIQRIWPRRTRLRPAAGERLLLRHRAGQPDLVDASKRSKTKMAEIVRRIGQFIATKCCSTAAWSVSKRKETSTDRQRPARQGGRLVVSQLVRHWRQRPELGRPLHGPAPCPAPGGSRAQSDERRQSHWHGDIHPTSFSGVYGTAFFGPRNSSTNTFRTSTNAKKRATTDSSAHSSGLLRDRRLRSAKS